MNTPQTIIKAFLELSGEEREEVRNFVNSTPDDVEFLIKAFDEEYVEKENYSEEDVAKLDRLQQEAEQGINMSGPFKEEEANEHLRKLMRKA